MDSDDAMDENGFDQGLALTEANESPSSGKATLKRGDACLACRRRRIRCNAAKPSCATCVRLKKECVYETGKSTSRIAQLKARIAELESQLSSRSPEQTSSGGEQGMQPGPFFPDQRQQDGRHESTPQHHHPQQHSHHNHQSRPATAPSYQSNSAPMTSGHHPEADTLGAVLGAAPRSGRMPYPQSTGPRPLGVPDEHFDFDLSFLDQPVYDLSAAMMTASMAQNDQIDIGALNRRYHGLSARSEVTGVPMRSPRAGTRGTSLPETAASPLGRAPPGEVPAVLNKMMGQFLKQHQQQSVSYFEENEDAEMEFLPSLGDIEILPSLPQGRELMGGWFDPNDIPPAVRDHLLDLFFSKTNAGNLFHVVFHLPRLYTRLTMPPNKRPHPCLMYAMYSCAARLSSQPAIKQLEGQFYSIAEKQIRLAIKNHDRLLDVVRAMALLVSYLFSKEQYSLGYHMTGTAVRLAISCGLDRIPTSVWSPQPPFNAAIHCTLRMGGYALPPPEDPIDLAERIYAFWAVYETDLCTAVAYLWHPGFPIDEIRTPLPRPMIEYELGIVSEKDDIPISSVFDATPYPYSSDTSFMVLRIKAVTFLSRVLKLRQDKPELEQPQVAPATPEPHGCSYPGSPFPAHITHPKGFASLKAGMDRFIASLPEQMQPPWQWDSEDDSDLGLPRVQMGRDTSILHFLIGNAYMQLWNVRALDAENTIAILIARRLVNVMYLFQTDPLSTGYDIFMITIWNEVAMILLREAKRLQYVGDAKKAALIDADLDVAITALKKWGDVDLANEHDGADIAAMNGKMLDQLRAMSEQDWAESIAESQRRYGGGGPGSPGVTPVSMAGLADMVCPELASSGAGLAAAQLNSTGLY
ncbi:hypothetical protein CcaverHIS002_0110890 [Cutaneotrichosporon cavernicola]|uniref:Zn(2)-C6 fungal-type domain-containing protein n=1 Tax=Cutaneotrichosporon cavernicola TaxID=279322 RepID=A0AA48HZJ0_9TREE|nr:uncharacterized protein CcaverHIS019_0110790 [Cutaneotrichosporon cavernicola]BEI80560.1 hypothetical protein CcaverHIS002_0110890 [Cutaneotrichosporon cavernicola]BEI88361.1 hypothetical protein CcaverHIS019_0110790 [Cutaneotrichosporon cavernicola]